MAVNLKLLKFNDKSTKNIDITDAIFVEQPNKQAIFDCILCENASLRQGTHSTLTKGEVRGGGKKPWRQKHTGRARTGSIRNPQWRGGGVVFGPKPNRNYEIKVNNKIRILAFKSALTLKLKNDNLFALDNNIKLEKPSTKLACQFIKNSEMSNKKVLVVTNNDATNIIKSIHNLEKVVAKPWNQVSVRDIINANVLIMYDDVFELYNSQFVKKFQKNTVA